jgi:hypothetical protein
MYNQQKQGAYKICNMKFPEFSRFSRPYTEYFPDNHTLNNDDVYQHQIQFNTSSIITKTNLVEHDDWLHPLQRIYFRGLTISAWNFSKK